MTHAWKRFFLFAIVVYLVAVTFYRQPILPRKYLESRIEGQGSPIQGRENKTTSPTRAPSHIPSHSSVAIPGLPQSAKFDIHTFVEDAFNSPARERAEKDDIRQNNLARGDIAPDFIIDKIQENQRDPPSWAKNNSTKDRPYVAETFYHHGPVPISKLVLGGPAMPYFPEGADKRSEVNLVWPARNQSEAVCTLRKNSPQSLTMASEIPHNLQQLLKCFSWWQLNPAQQPVLHLETKFDSKFIREFYQALEEVFGVRLDWVDRQSNAPAVTVHINWSRMPSLLDAYVMNSLDAGTLAKGFLDHYLPNNTRAGCPTKEQGASKENPKPVIGFLNREKSRRAVSNHPEILTALEEAGFDVKYKPNFDGMSLLEQIKFMAEIDILLGPHGAQFTNTLFQPECGSLFEFFNEGYYAPNFFGSLAALSGKHHLFLYNGGASNESHRFRSTPLFEVNPRVVVHVLHHMVVTWRSCCKHGFRGV